MIRFAVALNHPVAVRYPRGQAFMGYEEFHEPIVYGKSETIYEEEDIAIVSAGHMFETAAEVRRQLVEQRYHCSLINARFIKPFDEERIRELAKKHTFLVTIEENVKNGGFGQQVQSFVKAERLPMEVLVCALPDEYVEHGNVDILRREEGLSPETIVQKIISAYEE